MVLIVNNSERAITIIDVLLVPGIPTEILDERLDHPGVQSLFRQMTDKNVPVLVIVTEQPQEIKSLEHHVPTKAELLAKTQGE